MERLPADMREIRVIQKIPQNRVAYVAHVDPDLVGAPGF